MASAPDSNQDQDETNAGKPHSFSELARLARESKSSWDDAVPGRKADKQFLLAIAIAIVVVSGLTLISGYQGQLSVKSDTVNAEFSAYNNAPALAEPALLTEPALSESEPNAVTNPLLAEITRLNTRIAALQAQIIELNTAVAELESTAQAASAISTESIPALDRESPSLTPEPPYKPEPEPKPKPELKSEPVIKAPAIVEPATKKPAPVMVTAPISKEIGAPANLVPATIAPPNAVPADTASLAESPWFINIGAFSNSTSAAKLLSQVQGVVANAAIQDIQVKNQTLHRVRAFGYASRDEAKRDAQRLQSKLGLSTTWINKEK